MYVHRFDLENETFEIFRVVVFELETYFFLDYFFLRGLDMQVRISGCHLSNEEVLSVESSFCFFSK